MHWLGGIGGTVRKSRKDEAVGRAAQPEAVGVADGLGSTMAIVNASGAVQNSYTYDVYGKPTKTGSRSFRGRNFAGQQTDATGLQYLRARYMDPETGTFLSREPLGVAPTWTGNSTGYGSGSPGMFSEPTGLRPCHDPSGPCGGGSGPSARAGCSAYTYGLGVCWGGAWSTSTGTVIALLNARVKHAKDSKSANLNGVANFCTDVGKKSKSRTISLGGGEYAGACSATTLDDLDPRVSCEGKVHSSYGPGISFGVFGGECFNQFGAAVGGFAVSLDSYDPKQCALGALAGVVEGALGAAAIAGLASFGIGTAPPVGGTIASLAAAAGIGCALAGTWAAIS